jgi:hypothetical protein
LLENHFLGERVLLKGKRLLAALRGG